MPRNQAIGNSQRRIITCGAGPSGPPKKRVTTTADMVIVFMNSAMKNSAKRIDEYSVWKPPTSSCSASARSNGGRLSSAVIATRNMRNGTTPRRMTFQSQKCTAWLSTIALVDRDPTVATVPVTMIVVTIVSPSAASYEIICALALHRAEERVLGARRPSGQHYPVDRDRRHGEQKQYPDRGVCHLQLECVTRDRHQPADRHDR